MTPDYQGTKLALLAGEISLAYQPIHSLRTGALCGYEALARWGVLPPPVIAAIVESHSLQSLWIECQVQQISAVLQQIPDPLYVSINIDQSALDLDQLPGLLNAAVDPCRIIIEVLEAVRLTDKAAAALTRLKARHVLRADDVGSLEYGWVDRLIGGYAELFDGVKICKGLTYDAHTNRRTGLFCAAMLTICQELDLRTIAEWVRAPEQLEWLAARGCEAGQGELFGMPMPADTLQ